MRLSDELISFLRPTTLAAMIVDIENAGKVATGDLIGVGKRATKALERIVGKDEAQMMIEQEAGVSD